MPQKKTKSTQVNSPDDSAFPIVAMGSSAGGLEALECFFRHMPANSGMAFVLIVHLAPDQKSHLSHLLKNYTTMQVQEIKEHTKIEPNQIYITVPQKEVALIDRHLHLIDPISAQMRLPIDYFFQSLAEAEKNKAICVILSGTGSDGTRGLKAIKEAGGIALVQSLKSAQHQAMPRSAIATGLVDLVASAENLPEKLVHYVQHRFFQEDASRIALIDSDLGHLEKIFALLRNHTGHDFSGYKKNTMVRRIERRIAVHQLNSLEDYLHYLHKYPQEMDCLFKELLIGVTAFFREPEVFSALKKVVFPALLKDKSEAVPIRVWVPGCSTGEEAYSLAILLKEYLDAHQCNHKVQIFATDIDTLAIDLARNGLYSEAVVADLSPERLKSFFVAENGGFRVSKEIREMIIFAVQDLIKDPPFSKLDLVTCRNLLIYLVPEIQQQIFAVFHYTLVENGVLVLGNSESIGKASQLFHVLDAKMKFFRRKELPYQRRQILDLPMRTFTQEDKSRKERSFKHTQPTSWKEYIENYLLENHCPSCVIVDQNQQILYFYGKTGKYLEPPSKNNSLNILEMSREDLKISLSTSMRKARISQQTIIVKNLSIRANSELNTINLIIHPIQESELLNGNLLLVFEELPFVKQEKKSGELSLTPPFDERVQQLEQELSSTQTYLQTIIEELETVNEELKSTNEELQSANEELQSTNEELETSQEELDTSQEELRSVNEELDTSQEELRSVNEELLTLNGQLESKLQELLITNNDLNNLLSNTDIATLFLDNQLQIKRFTSGVEQILNLIPGDIGRPFTQIVSNLKNYETLSADATAVVNTLVSKEVEFQTTNDKWFLMRIRPYRTIDNYIDGLVITFVDISEQKQSELRVRQAGQNLENAQRIGMIGSWEWNWQSQTLSWSDELYRIHGQNRADYSPSVQSYPSCVLPEDRALLPRGNMWKLEELKSLDYRIVDPKTQEVKQVFLKGEILFDKEGQALRSMGILQDISEHKKPAE